MTKSEQEQIRQFLCALDLLHVNKIEYGTKEFKTAMRAIYDYITISEGISNDLYYRLFDTDPKTGEYKEFMRAVRWCNKHTEEIQTAVQGNIISFTVDQNKAEKNRLMEIYGVKMMEMAAILYISYSGVGERICPGMVVSHFKRDKGLPESDPEYLYKVNDIFVRNSETGERMVYYTALYDSKDGKVHKGDRFIRPYEMFIGKTDKKKYPDAVQEYRFAPVSASLAKAAGITGAYIINSALMMFVPD